MALPHWLARVNLAIGNRLLRPFTGILPGFGVLEHVGRRSGVRRQTPLTVFRHGDRYVIALTYGPDVQWVKNVLAAGGCRVRNRGPLGGAQLAPALQRPSKAGGPVPRPADPGTAARKRVSRAAEGLSGGLTASNSARTAGYATSRLESVSRHNLPLLMVGQRLSRPHYRRSR